MEDMQTRNHCDTVMIAGLGLIGGSLAAALREAKFSRCILAWDRSRDSLDVGRRHGLIDEAVDDFASAARRADLIVVAVPTLAVEEVFIALNNAQASAVVTDVASVKGSVLSAAERVYGAVPSNFVPGHPIAGRERSGVDSADSTLFRGHRVILTPLASTRPEAVAVVEAMWAACGAEHVHMEADHHDRILAFTSHLPHVLAYALVRALASEDDSEEIFRFAAGGFRDFTRIASSDPVMWSNILMANRIEVLAALDHFAATLGRLREDVARSDAEGIRKAFADAQAARNRYLGWLESRFDA